MKEHINYPGGYKIYQLNSKWWAEAPNGDKKSDNVRRGVELQVRHHQKTGRWF